MCRFRAGGAGNDPIPQCGMQSRNFIKRMRTRFPCTLILHVAFAFGLFVAPEELQPILRLVVRWRPSPYACLRKTVRLAQGP